MVGFDVMPSLVTFELGSVTPRPNAETTHEGPWVQHDRHEVSLADGEQDLMILPFRLDPGTYRVVAQVTGREESRAAGEAYLDLPEVAPEPEPVEHWWVSFVRESSLS